MIRTRQLDVPNIAGDGDFVIAMTFEELLLVASLLGMVKLGQRPYEIAALNLLDAIEDVTSDRDFSLTALTEVQPTFDVRDPNTLDVIAQYDETYVIEVNV